MNVIKVLWHRFQKCLGTCAMLLVETSSKMGLFRYLSNHVFGVRKFWNTKAMRFIFFFWKYSKFKLDFKNPAKYWDKVFCVWDYCIWIGIVKLSPLRTGYFSSTANVLTNSNKILQVSKRDFFQLNWLGRDQWIW